MFGRFFTILLVCAVCFTGCKTRKSTVSHQKKHRTVQERKPAVVKETNRAEEPEVVRPPANVSYSDRVANYINEYSVIAKEEMLQYGIPASIKLAQAILESGAGAGELTQKAQNHFGIKCHTGWEEIRSITTMTNGGNVLENTTILNILLGIIPYS